MKLVIPELALVVLIGASGSGKSTFARDHFKPTEVISSDYCRALVADNENDQSATKDAFEVLNVIVSKRLERGNLAVVDATNVQPAARQPLLQLAREHHVIPVALVFDLPEELSWQRTQQRPDRHLERRVIAHHQRQLKRSLKQLKKEGFRYVYIFRLPEDVAEAQIERQPLWSNRKHEHGPFDIIGDVHGCASELESLLEELGYTHNGTAYAHPEGRKALFVGDIVDRGPRILDSYEIVRAMVEAGSGLCVPGNHDMKLVRKLRGRPVKVAHGLAETLAELEALPAEQQAEYKEQLAAFFDSLVSHYVLDAGKLVVAHAGMKESMQGRGSKRVRDFALYGETTGETDEFGLPVRYNWAADYRGSACVVYGHTPVPEPQWLNRTINVDTGCVFGGQLTALRYPENELVSVPAAAEYAVPARPLNVPANNASERTDDLLQLEDVTGKRIVQTRLRGNVTIRDDQATAALEVMSRFAADPRWLIYLPPTMSPAETSSSANLLEHPAQAFDYYRRQGVVNVVVEQKHMGSRTIVIVCRDEAAALERFGMAEIGICYTRTGRRFFDDAGLEAALLEHLQQTLSAANWWETFQTSWIALDCELMPWSAKAQALIKQQYAGVGAVAEQSLAVALEILAQAEQRLPELHDIRERTQQRLTAVERYRDAYREYCWPVEKLADLRLAPFFILASEGTTYTDRAHTWHMQTIASLCQHDQQVLFATSYRTVDLNDAASCAVAIEWWETLTAAGSEGVVIKPADVTVRGKRGLIQPALKSRGPEYLRIIYGPEYLLPANLERLRSRSLHVKRSLALREFALGIEALERFVAGEPLYRVHQCVFGILAMESEPVDPRL